MPSNLEIGVVITLFSAIIGVYIYMAGCIERLDLRVEKELTKMQTQVVDRDRRLDEKIDMLTAMISTWRDQQRSDLAEFRTQVVERLARLEGQGGRYKPSK